jgi:hypothetical protein
MCTFSLHAYIHTYMHTDRHTWQECKSLIESAHLYLHFHYMHTYIHAFIHGRNAKPWSRVQAEPSSRRKLWAWCLQKLSFCRAKKVCFYACMHVCAYTSFMEGIHAFVCASTYVQLVCYSIDCIHDGSSCKQARMGVYVLFCTYRCTDDAHICTSKSIRKKYMVGANYNSVL